ncbi:RNA pseudouridine synthase [Ignatzschineria ureiclastica]|uniref:Pseudouridine synthase n=1 Tax=Ignatzschineria ureiclastica TaxID=472582 RepID=A0A2U2AE03_9GAMM|nr:RluA family pseudouridine synthase [Ignatzschineria ureiclastica]PWD80892.1 RNA pseudouridine synthase [Ignatzschineria ureiclastica]GGZ94081.1 pseudouridine synthase [Ignatzschineria ureiclastica]
MKYSETFTISIPDHLDNQRIDATLPILQENLSRSQVQKLIKSGQVLLNGEVPKPKDPVSAGDTITITIEHSPEEDTLIPEKIALDILYEDDDLMVINKPAGMVVHPGAGNHQGTLANALLHHAPKLAELSRAGIVHRLDKETSGLLLIAKTMEAEENLINQFKERTPTKIYHALVIGELISGRTIDAPIGRNPYRRKHMWVPEPDEDGNVDGKDAITHIRVKERFRAHTLVEANIETGRTHQIRVHMQHINYPIVGDSDYGARLKLPKKFGQHAENVLRGFKRQALHAFSIQFNHPRTGEELYFEQDYPNDMTQLIDAIREESQQYEQNH